MMRTRGTAFEKIRIVLAAALLTTTVATVVVLGERASAAQGGQPAPIGPVGLTLTPILDT